MNAEELLAAAREGRIPEGLAPALRALCLAEAGQWDAAHAASQEGGDAAGAWVHACLHREEGDEGNARYWYARARQKPATGPVSEERLAIARALLGEG